MLPGYPTDLFVTFEYGDARSGHPITLANTVNLFSLAKLIIIFILLLAQPFNGYSQPPGTRQGTNPRSSASPANKSSIDSLSYIPKPVGWTNDFKKLFLKEEVTILDSLISNYERKTRVEITVATIDSSMLGPINFEPYTLLMLRTWGVGKKETNNGVLIVIAPDLRRVRIQTGYGIEKILSNEETREIIDSVMMPAFRRNNFFEGTKEGILAIIGKLDN